MSVDDGGVQFLWAIKWYKGYDKYKIDDRDSTMQTSRRILSWNGRKKLEYVS